MKSLKLKMMVWKMIPNFQGCIFLGEPAVHLAGCTLQIHPLQRWDIFFWPEFENTGSSYWKTLSWDIHMGFQLKYTTGTVTSTFQIKGTLYTYTSTKSQYRDGLEVRMTFRAT